MSLYSVRLFLVLLERGLQCSLFSEQKSAGAGVDSHSVSHLIDSPRCPLSLLLLLLLLMVRDTVVQEEQPEGDDGHSSFWWW